MPIIIVRVLLRSKTVFEWEGLPVDEDMNIKDFFNDVEVNELKIELWGKNCIAYFSPTKTGEMEKIGLKSMNTINAFELMKSASMLNYLPEFKLPARNSLGQLRIDGGGWIGKDNANNIGKRFVSVLTKSTTYAALCNKSSEYLINQRAITAENQNLLTHIVDEGKAGYIGNIWRKTEIIKEFRILIKALEKLEYWKLVDINQFCPVSRK
ncbi:unnamed protein product [Rhizophagus irregularis]|nr:unnamed protein product [Rhizophagus irregularis]